MSGRHCSAVSWHYLGVVRRRTTIAFSAVLGLAAGCGQSATGVDIAVRLGQLEYDELQFQLTQSAPGTTDSGMAQTLVDPATNGRYVGPFRPGDQSVIVYVADELDGVPVRCAASALRAGAVVATGVGDVMIERSKLKHVEIVMGSATDGTPVTGAGGAAGATATGAAGSGSGSGSGGSAPATGAAGAAGAPTTGTAGSGGSMPATGAAGSGGSTVGTPNGGACNVGAECISCFCADGACCESDCRMSCRSCALPDARGLCRPVPLGTPDPRGMCMDKGPASCQTNGLCDVAGRCADYAAGTSCAPAACSSKDEVVQARVCDGAGKCEAEVKVKCAKPSLCTSGVCS